MSAYHCFIEAKLMTAGVLRRSDLMNAFDVATPTATRQIASYKLGNANAILLDHSRRVYVAGPRFSPHNLRARRVTAEEFLRAVEIVHGTGPQGSTDMKPHNTTARKPLTGLLGLTSKTPQVSLHAVTARTPLNELPDARAGSLLNYLPAGATIASLMTALCLVSEGLESPSIDVSSRIYTVGVDALGVILKSMCAAGCFEAADADADCTRYVTCKDALTDFVTAAKVFYTFSLASSDMSHALQSSVFSLISECEH